MNLSFTFATLFIFCLFSLISASGQKPAKSLSKKASSSTAHMPLDHPAITGLAESQCPHLQALKALKAKGKADSKSSKSDRK